MSKRLVVLTALFINVATAESAGPIKPEILPHSEEFEMALSAAPRHLQTDAGVYVLEAEGVRQARSSNNGFNCIINRDHPLNRKPTCYDAEGSATILPKVIMISDMMVQGKTMVEINQAVHEGFASGKFIAPRRPGVAYMLTEHIRTYNSQTGGFGTFPPHIMFYAPNLTSADIGWTREGAQSNPWLPSIAYPGPHGFMIVVPPSAGN
jgi:hypothetical protein